MSHSAFGLPPVPPPTPMAIQPRDAHNTYDGASSVVDVSLDEQISLLQPKKIWTHYLDRALTYMRPLVEDVKTLIDDLPTVESETKIRDGTAARMWRQILLVDWYLILLLDRPERNAFHCMSKHSRLRDVSQIITEAEESYKYPDHAFIIPLVHRYAIMCLHTLQFCVWRGCDRFCSDAQGRDGEQRPGKSEEPEEIVENCDEILQLRRIAMSEDGNSSELRCMDCSDLRLNLTLRRLWVRFIADQTYNLRFNGVPIPYDHPELGKYIDVGAFIRQLMDWSLEELPNSSCLCSEDAHVEYR